MDSGTLATGFSTILSDFSTDYGPLVLVIAGIAVGLYGLRFLYGFATQLIRTRMARG